jgi:hypothetical protein
MEMMAGTPAALPLLSTVNRIKSTPSSKVYCAISGGGEVGAGSPIWLKGDA